MMDVLHIEDAMLVQRLRMLAQQEARPVEVILNHLLDDYERRNAALIAMAGMFDNDLPDLSDSVRETMRTYYQERHDNAG